MGIATWGQHAVKSISTVMSSGEYKLTPRLYHTLPALIWSRWPTSASPDPNLSYDLLLVPCFTVNWLLAYTFW